MRSNLTDVLIVVACFVAGTCSALATATSNAICVKGGTCGNVSQACLNIGGSCNFCSGVVTGNFCAAKVDSFCHSTGQFLCGTQIQGICSGNPGQTGICSGSSGNNVDCTVLQCLPGETPEFP